MMSSKFLILALAPAFLIAGCATQAVPGSATPYAEKDVPIPHDCLKSTGTRLRVPEGECALARGSTYTREELEQTGGFGLAQSLGRLLPY